jgi:hypothetical protein
MDSNGRREQWFKFDDELVTKATPEEAIDDNFGGEESPLRRAPFPINDRPIYKRSANACEFQRIDIYLRLKSQTIFLQKNL